MLVEIKAAMFNFVTYVKCRGQPNIFNVKIYLMRSDINMETAELFWALTAT